MVAAILVGSNALDKEGIFIRNVANGSAIQFVGPCSILVPRIGISHEASLRRRLIEHLKVD